MWVSCWSNSLSVPQNSVGLGNGGLSWRGCFREEGCGYRPSDLGIGLGDPPQKSQQLILVQRPDAILAELVYLEMQVPSMTFARGIEAGMSDRANLLSGIDGDPAITPMLARWQ